MNNSAFVPPSQQRRLRACMVCSIVQTHEVSRKKPEAIKKKRKKKQIYKKKAKESRSKLITKDNGFHAAQRFYNQGCPNCEDYLSLAGSSDAIQECTSQIFEGLITMADPTKSWVARWQWLNSYVPGVYAVKVVGTVSHF